MNALPSWPPSTGGTKRRSRGLALIVVASLVALEPATAHAYIDPGTGSMLLQSLLAAVAAALVFGRTIWHRVKSFFSRDKRKPTHFID